MSPHLRHALLSPGVAAALLGLLGTPALHSQTTTRVTVSNGGAQGDATSGDPVISSDARYVFFYSSATNLVTGDTNLVRDVFVRDLQTSSTQRVSVSSGGAEGNALSSGPAISPDGRYVAFYSDATNLVAGDTNLVRDAFLRDRQTGTTTRVSVSTGGVQGDALSSEPVVSADGRFVAFYSSATNLVPGDNNLLRDVFVRDLQTSTTTRVSVSTGGAEGNALSSGPKISADGRYVAFYSDATNLVPGDNDLVRDVFVRDLQLNTTTRVSVTSAGGEGNAASSGPAVSSDGRYIAFYSNADNLVPGDTNLFRDTFVRDTQAGTTTRVSVSTAGAQGNDLSSDPTISATGRYVVFYSDATNLVLGDTNLFRDVFVRDRQANKTRRLSVATGGTQGNELSSLGEGLVITPDGRYVVFYSDASNLVGGDSNLARDGFLRDTSPWTDLGGPLAGVNGDPLLVGAGSMVAGDTGSLSLSSAAPSSLAALFVSFTSTPVPLKGGVLQAFPTSLQVNLFTNGAGSLTLPFVTPSGIPSGLNIYFQFLIPDAAAIHGVAFSNAVKALVP
jgi:Tol biopolymer transport system component